MPRLLVFKNKRRNKYGNKKAEFDGIKFASKKEARRYGELLLLRNAGHIAALKLQPKFIFTITAARRGSLVTQALAYDSGRYVTYIADFSYIDKHGVEVVEDVKGVKTREYKIKKALMWVVNGIEVKEV